jgi:hypothetical protein
VRKSCVWRHAEIGSIHMPHTKRVTRCATIDHEEPKMSRCGSRPGILQHVMMAKHVFGNYSSHSLRCGISRRFSPVPELADIAGKPLEVSPSTTSTTSPPPTSLLVIPITSEAPATAMSVSFVSLPLFLLPPHHLSLPLQTLCLELLRALFYPHLRLLEICGKPSMRAVTAALSFWTEATKIERAQLLLLVVFECAVGTQRAESAIVVWTRGSLGFGIDV